MAAIAVADWPLLNALVILPAAPVGFRYIMVVALGWAIYHAGMVSFVMEQQMRMKD
jgi:hypothetical protein